MQKHRRIHCRRTSLEKNSDANFTFQIEFCYFTASFVTLMENRDVSSEKKS